MGKKASFLPGLHRALFGRPPVSTVEKLSRRRGELDELCLSQLTALFGAFLPAKLLDFKPASGANSRRRDQNAYAELFVRERAACSARF